MSLSVRWQHHMSLSVRWQHHVSLSVRWQHHVSLSVRGQHHVSISVRWQHHMSLSVYKNGNRQICDNYRGISLLTIAGKLLARVLLNRLIVQLEKDLLPERQCGFRGGRGTVDMIFSARQLQEKCQELYDDFFITFIDLTKAFDTVCRDGLWQIMEKFG